MKVSEITIKRKDNGEIEIVVLDDNGRIEAYEVSHASRNQVKNIVMDGFIKN